MNFLFSLLGGLPGILGQYFTARAQLQMMQLLQSSSFMNGQAELGEAQIGATSRGFKEWFIVLWFIPMVLIFIWPSEASIIFDRLKQAPIFYLESCQTVFYAVLGISVGAPIVTGIIGHLREFVSSGREFKIQREHIKNRRD